MFKTILRTSLATLAGVAFVLVANGTASADVVIHISTEVYYDSGGTDVDCSLGCTDFIAGDISGTAIWKVQEDVAHLTSGNTKFAYNVTNLGVPGNPGEITSFHVPVPGNVPFGLTAPPGWSVMFDAVAEEIWWTTAGAGIPFLGSLDTMMFTVSGLHSVDFVVGVELDIDGGAPFTMDDWIISSVPLPGAVLLGAIGLAGVGWLKRRFV